MAGVTTALIWVLFLLGALVTPHRAGQLLPVPGDTDIRAAYWELRNETEVWLTLEPKTPKGNVAPMLTFTFTFAGKLPAAPPTSIDVRAYAGAFFAPQVELWFQLDGSQKIDLGAKKLGLTTGMATDYLSEPVPIETLKQMASAHRIVGRALGVEFELRDSQIAAIRTFLERVRSGNPAQQPRR